MADSGQKPATKICEFCNKGRFLQKSKNAFSGNN